MSTDAEDPELELLLEAATGAARSRDSAGRIEPAPAWADLDEDGRRRLYERQCQARVLERAVDPAGDTATTRDVARRAAEMGQLPRG